jgi:exodeoxyribonuclease VII large subunit
MEESKSLSHLITTVKQTLDERFKQSQWVVVEISELNINRSGHCYLELIEKDVLSDKIIAKCRGTIWAFAFRMIRPYFETSTGETLHSGLKVLVKASIEFHEVYGFSLNISDIDPQYTIGEMAMKRVKIIQKLESDGVLTMNKELNFPMVPQHIAVISSETAAGYDDFKNQLENNAAGFSFSTKLYPAIMQGEKASQSIIQAFEQIYETIEQFDLVVLLRGGGSKSDLSCFDDYELSYYITQFPMPVLTGIGHERDDSVCDLVAHTKLKTPTAVAEFLIQTLQQAQDFLDASLEQAVDIFNNSIDEKEDDLHGFMARLQLASTKILASKTYKVDLFQTKLNSGLKQYFHDKEYQILQKSNNFRRMASQQITYENELLNRRSVRVNKWVQHYLESKEKQLLFLEEKNQWANPQHILERGYAIVRSNNKVIKDAADLKKGDSLNIQLAKGNISGTVD